MVVNGPFHPFVPCADAALQPREYLIREPIVVDAPLDCVWCADTPPCNYTTLKGNRGGVCLAILSNEQAHFTLSAFTSNGLLKSGLVIYTGFASAPFPALSQPSF